MSHAVEMLYIDKEVIGVEGKARDVDGDDVRGRRTGEQDAQRAAPRAITLTPFEISA